MIYTSRPIYGAGIYTSIYSVYRDSANYCVILVSQAYVRKLWTRHELQQAQARAFQENREYILPLRLDDTELPGLNYTVGYIDVRRTTLEEVAELLLRKVFGKEFDEMDRDRLSWKGEMVEYQGTETASFWPTKIVSAQTKTRYVITREFERIPYGNESHPWDTSIPCHDCGVLKGQLHVPSCDVEECPACHEQVISCGCEKLGAVEPLAT